MLARHRNALQALVGADHLHIAAPRQNLFHQVHVGQVVFNVQHGALGLVAAPKQGHALQRQERRAARVGRGLRLLELDPKLTAHAKAAFHANGAAHQLGELLGHHQPDARALGSRGFAPQAVKGFKQLGQLVRAQAFARVGHADAQTAARAGFDADLDAATRPVVLDGVGQQIDHHLLEPHGVCHHPHRLLHLGKLQINALLFGMRLGQVATFAQQLGQRQGLQMQSQLARFNQGQVQNLVDEFEQVPAPGQNPVDIALLQWRGRRRAGFKQLRKADDGVQR